MRSPVQSWAALLEKTLAVLQVSFFCLWDSRSQDFFIFVFTMKVDDKIHDSRVLDERVLEQLCVMVDTVTADIREIVASGQYPVVVLLRGYELLEVLQDTMPELQEIGVLTVLKENRPALAKLEEALLGYRDEFERSGQSLMKVLDREVIARKAEGYLQPWKRKYEKAKDEYRKAVELHEAAKVAHQAQCEGGFFEKWRTLRQVRKMAGFRLERRRTGNFVARTLDLMQQAMLVARDAELAMYSHNVEYKCNPDVYMKINELLTKKT